jgi:hypothetical protein
VAVGMVRGFRLQDGFVCLCNLGAKLLIGASNVDVAKRHGGLQTQRGSYLIEAMVWLGVVAGVASPCCGLRRQCLGGRALRSSHSNNHNHNHNVATADYHLS